MSLTTFWIMIISIIAVGSLILNIIAEESHAQKSHSHEGLQVGDSICIEGEGAIDYDLNTKRPFLVCGEIHSFRDTS